MKSIAVLLLLPLLASCLTTPDRPPEPVITIRVAVPEECQVDVPSEPSYHYDEAKKEMAADDKVKLLRAEVRQRRGDQQELRKLLKACTDAAPTK